jgi:hypothetical protein
MTVVDERCVNIAAAILVSRGSLVRMVVAVE